MDPGPTHFGPPIHNCSLLHCVPSMMGRLLLSFLLVATVVASLCTVAVRLVYQKTTSSPFVLYTPRTEGIATKQGRWYIAQHIIAESQDFEENRRNETCMHNASSTVLSLMCLATRFGGVRVVEPVVVNSDLGVNGSKSWTEQLNF